MSGPHEVVNNWQKVRRVLLERGDDAAKGVFTDGSLTVHGRILMICNSATTIAPKIVSTTAAQKIAENMGIAKAIRRPQPGQATAVLEI